jgi:hypothetical protein
MTNHPSAIFSRLPGNVVIRVSFFIAFALSTMIAQDIRAAAEEVTLTLQVNTSSGATKILGDPFDDIAINYYEIRSLLGSLDVTNWLSLEDQDFEGSGPLSGPGEGWEEAGGASDYVLVEAWLLGSSTVTAEASISLGMAYDFGDNAQDLTFAYGDENGDIFAGLVNYVPEPATCTLALAALCLALIRRQV